MQIIMRKRFGSFLSDTLNNRELAVPVRRRLQNTRNRCVLLWSFFVFFLLGIAVIVVSTVLTGSEKKPKKERDYERFLNHYSVDNSTLIQTRSSLHFLLKRDENPDFRGDIIQPEVGNNESSVLRVDMVSETKNRLHLTIRDHQDSSRWEVPLNTEDELTLQQEYQKPRFTPVNITHDRYSFILLDEQNAPVVASCGTYFRYMEKYVSFELIVKSTRFFGLGERITNINLKEGTYTLFPKHEESSLDALENLSGMHPFLFFQLFDRSFAGLFLKTSTALEVKLSFGKTQSKVRFTTVGGIIDLYIFYRGSAQFILKQYHQVIGKPELPPLWTLGYHHGKTGFRNVTEVKRMVELFHSHDIPLDAVWVDTDLLENGMNFITDKERFGGLKEVVSELHKECINFVPVVKSGLKIDRWYWLYVNSNEAGCLIRTFDNKRNHYGMDQYGYIAYPNFMESKMCPIWQEGISRYYNETLFDGIFLTMNEPYNACNGDCLDEASTHPFDNLPFVPGTTPLNHSTLSMSALYSDRSNSYYELYMHSLNSVLMANCTYSSLKSMNPSVRPFVVSTATFPGIQKFTSGHLSLSTASTWEHLHSSISTILNFNLFGLPLSGSSICGYYNNSTKKLCQDWARLGALYPLSVNFNSNQSVSQDPYEFSMILRYKNAIRFKYSLLRFIYTKVFEAALYGGSAIQPVCFEFPYDDLAYRTSDRTFMYGKELLVTSPIQDEKEYSVYFPNAHWFSFPKGELLFKYHSHKQEGTILQLSTNTEIPNVFLRGGSIVPYQDAITPKIKNVQELTKVPLTIIVALDQNGKAKGTIAVDDGISANTIKNKAYRYYAFTFSNRKLKITLTKEEGNSKEPAVYPFEHFTELQIWGAKKLADATSACILTYDLLRIPVKVSYSSKEQIMTVKHNKELPLKMVEAIILYKNGNYNYCAGEHYASNLKLIAGLSQLYGNLKYRSGETLYTYNIWGSVLNKYVVNLNIQPLNWTAWEVPGIINRIPEQCIECSSTFAEYFFGVSQEPDPFYFLVSYPNDLDQVIITTKDQPLIITKNFTQLSIWLNATSIYGLGERASSTFCLHTGRYTVYAADDPSPRPETNLHGSHPFIMFRLPDSSFAGIFLLTSNALDVDIRRSNSDSYVLTFLLSGGLIDLYFIQRGSPTNVVARYHKLIGKPYLPPYWAFGNNFYAKLDNQEQLSEIVTKYERAELPLDALWLGMEYMDNMNPFTMNTRKFSNLKGLVKHLHIHGVRFVPLLVPQIPVNETNFAFKEGTNQNIFIKTPQGKPVEGVSWPGYSSYVDFINPNSKQYWVSMLDFFAENLAPFDGVLLDQNEVTQFCDGSCESTGDEEDLNYIPGHRSLQKSALPLDSKHYSTNEIEEETNIEYNLHSLYGHLQAKTTSEYFLQKNRRGLIVSRSTFAGSGAFSAHVFSRLPSSWTGLQSSLAQIYLFQTFGISLSAPIICSQNETDLELCQRLYQLAIFYPLFINPHYTLFALPELYATAQIALKLRYSLIRYIYSLQFKVSLYGGTYFNPLFYEFPDDHHCYYKFDSFMLGSALKITPVLEKSQKTVTAYFPNQDWFNLLQGRKVVEYKKGFNKGEYISLDADLNKNIINVHIRGGSIIPFQFQGNIPIHNTYYLTNNPTSLIIALDEVHTAKGFAVFDEGEGSYSLMHKEYHWFAFSCEKGKLLIDLVANSKYIRSGYLLDEVLDQILIYGADAYKDVEYGCAYLTDGSMQELQANYETKSKKLVLKFQAPAEILKVHTIVWKGFPVDCRNSNQHGLMFYSSQDMFQYMHVEIVSNSISPIVTIQQLSILAQLYCTLAHCSRYIYRIRIIHLQLYLYSHARTLE
eukprot:TRINITY_DN378_c0_g1_i4.p1 TRINITY_DN378_c0_g1~~TRINITY_DN378_c0_g1_i4.p1  ORF type:complete len:1843 (+),score=69.26 TRINITY_DN378_c0_g1_i4:3855-9383(+)